MNRESTAADAIAAIVSAETGLWRPGARDVADKILDAVCPPGSRVVVSRESKPCDECAGTGNRFYEVAEGFCDCIGCGGSGVVEATTTTTPVEPGRGEMVWQSIGGAEAPRWAKTWRAVALPEETPQ